MVRSSFVGALLLAVVVSGRKSCTLPEGSVASIAWCEATCNHDNPVCPSSLCTCTDEQEAPSRDRLICEGSGVLRSDLLTPWCNLNCNHNPSFCPSSYCSCFDSGKLLSDAHTLLVSGTITPISYFPEEALEGIDRFLHVEFDLPALEMSPTSHDGFFNASDTLCSDTYTCPSLSYSVCPGMDVTTLMTRSWNTPEDLIQASPPSFTWTSSPSSYYTLLFVDLLNQDTAFDYFFHWGVTNIQDNNIEDGISLRSYLGPGNPSPDSANHYTFLLFEHDSPMTQEDVNATFSLFAANPFAPLSSVMDTLGIESTDLVGVNWFDGFGSIGSRIAFIHDPNFAGFPAPPCLFSPIDACFPVPDFADCGYLSS